MVDVLRFSSRTVLKPTLIQAFRTHNGNVANFGQLVQNTVGEEAELMIFDCDVGTIAAGSRLSVILSVMARFQNGNDAWDLGTVLFRVLQANPWIKIDQVNIGDAAWPQAPAAAIFRTFDITIPAGITVSTTFQIGLQFFNGNAANPTPSEFTSQPP